MKKIFQLLFEAFIKKEGRKPNNLEMILLKQKAMNQAIDKRKILDMRGDVLDPNKPILGGTQSGTKLDKEFAAGIMKATGSKPTGSKPTAVKQIFMSDKDFKDLRRSFRMNIIRNDRQFNEDLAKQIINREIYTDLAKGQRKNLLDDLDQVFKGEQGLAGGGIAGMLGEPTYQDDIHRVPFKDAKSVEGPMGPQNFYDIGFGSILDDVMRDSPKKRYTKKDLENIWNILQGEHDVENWEDELMFRFGRHDPDPDKKSDFFFELGKGKAGVGYKKETDFINRLFGKGIRKADGGLAPLLGEPTYADGGRTGFKGKKFDPKRRGFLKVAAGLASIPIIGKYFKWAKPLAKTAKVADLTSVPIKNIKGMPAWFKPLVNKVIKEGNQIESGAERVIVHKTKLPNSKTDVYVEQNLDTGNVSVDLGLEKHGFADGHLGQPVRLEYKAAEEIEPILPSHMDPKNPKGPWKPHKAQKTKEEFWVEEAEFTGGHPENVKFEETTFEKFGQHGSDFSEVEKFATGKVTKSSKGKKEVWEADWDDSLPEGDEGFGKASGGRVPLVRGKKVADPGYFKYKESGDEPYWYVKGYDASNPEKMERVRKRLEEAKEELIKQGIIERKIFSEADRMPPENIFLEAIQNPEIYFPTENTPEELEEFEKNLRLKQEVKDGGRVPLKGGKKVLEGLLALGKGAAKGEGKFTKSEVLLQMFKNTIKQNKDAGTKKRFANFIKEIQSKPELANDPQVWNFFTKGLPKNQKLVVYGDDTVDFWRQSDFGPHNIQTTDKFMKKHPHLTRDQAVKIQNMEPEDQIFEMKKIEALRKKDMHAEGGIIGRVPYWKGGSWKAIKEAMKHNKIFGLGGPPYKPGATSFDIKQLTKDRFGSELSLQDLKDTAIKDKSFSKFLEGFKEYKAGVIKQQLLNSKQEAQLRIKVSKDMLKNPPKGLDLATSKKVSEQMIRDAEKQLKDLDAALKDIDIYKAMKEKTGVSSHASGGLAGMLGE